jgi:hypothetical protein
VLAGCCTTDNLGIQSRAEKPISVSTKADLSQHQQTQQRLSIAAVCCTTVVDVSVWPRFPNKQFENQWNSRILAVQDVTLLQGERFELFKG